ncbi:arginine-tRNA-protein transferase [Vararia minispora EC-137]|uniref:Arginine-tRNA-protein transferase n=1 Tax=Vararia minispora EC-137 TaxID=1314806 RepID=A0ACB8QPG8_9AGAM|nr:arginine-tRNA-protein transferase [Vararia minispora EC-137]
MDASDSELLITSAVVPYGPSASTCGYCGPSGQRSELPTFLSQSTFVALRLLPDFYQGMIDRGWRRSGTYCYKPDLKASCCPQYTIKLDALGFAPTKGQRKLLNRWNRFVLDGDTKNAMDTDRNDNNEVDDRIPSGSPKNTKRFDLDEAIHVSECAFVGERAVAHKFEVVLEPSSFTEEKFTLYQNYEANIHHKPEKLASSFDDFLVESPLIRGPIPYPSPPPSHLPTEWGSYHQLYRLDGKLIAMGVIDILPSCISSVYFMWEKEYEKFSLGKLSALREISLAREIHKAGSSQMNYLYMGFYIHTCQKMRYKGEYHPSYLADPEDFTWHALEKCRSLLDSNRYACFSHPEHSMSKEDPLPSSRTKVRSASLCLSSV